MAKLSAWKKRVTLILLSLTLALILATTFVLWPKVSSYQVLFNSLTGIGSPTSSQATKNALAVPPRFELSIFADHLPNARLLKIAPTGQLLVSSPRTGAVYLLTDHNHDGKAESTTQLIGGLKHPHGIDLYDDGRKTWLYIAETHAIGRIAIDWRTGKTLGDYESIMTDLPDDGGHRTRTIQFSRDNWLYLTIGSSCNVCLESDIRRATMMRVRPDGSDSQIYATGLRNSVGFDWAPWNNELYATDNGRDLLGDNYPPCELNQITAGGFYGWPHINGFGELDPDYGKGQDFLLKTSISPSFGFRAHNAPLGIHFLRHPSLPESYQRTALVALHGSWNRSEPDGYKVVALRWDDMGTITSEDFMTHFLQPSGQIIGRPVDIEEGPDGSIYISDDYAGAIYRVLYK